MVKKVEHEDSISLANRLGDITTMAEMANASDRCFRQALISHLVADAMPRKSWSMRILEWAFGERLRTEKAEVCCDSCSPDLTAELAQGGGHLRAK